MPKLANIVIISLAGMRGIVSLAAALSIPVGVPQRDLILFLTYVSIVVTLLIPSLLIGPLLRHLNLSEDGEHLREELDARLKMANRALDYLVVKQEGFPPELATSMVQRITKRKETLEQNLTEGVSPFDLRLQAKRKLLQELNRVERQELAVARHAQVLHDEVFHQLSRELDLEDLRLKTQRV